MHTMTVSWQNRALSQVENLRQTCDRSYDNFSTNLKIFCKVGSRTPFLLAFVHLSVETVI